MLAMQYSCNILIAIKYYKHFFLAQQVDEYIIWGITHNNDIFSCSGHFIPSQDVIALKVVFLTWVRNHSKLILPAFVWSFPIDIMLQYSALSRRNCAYSCLEIIIFNSCNLYFPIISSVNYFLRGF